MATSPIALPDGFVLDDKPAAPTATLPDGFELDAPPSGAETFGEHAATSIAPGTAFALAAPRGAKIGAGIGAMIPGAGETVIPEAVGAFVGGLVTGGIASWAAYKAQHAALKSVAPKFTDEMDRRLQAGQEAHPFLSVAGDVAGNLPSMELSIPSLKQLPFRAALGGTVGAVMPLTQGRLPNKEDVASGAAMATLFGRSRFEPKEAAATGKIPLSDIPETEQETLPIEGAESKAPAEEDLQNQLDEELGQTPESKMATVVAKSDLEDDHQFMLDEAAKSQGAKVHVVDPSELPDDQPFARLKSSLSSAISTIDRRDNRILINPVEFKKWMSQIPEENQKAATESLINEEKIHLGVDDKAATDYWNSLTGLEKSIAKKRYSGDWTGRNFSDLSDTDWGHEALRFRLQQLSRMTPREIADSVGTEHWTFRSITALESLIRGLRNTFGKGDTKAIVNRMAGNLNIAKATAINSSSPAARNRYQAQNYSQEDLKRYQDLNRTLVNLSENAAGSPEHLAVWKQFEELRNKYGGMPPAQLQPKVDLQAATQAQAESLNEAAAQYEASGDKPSADELRQMAKDIGQKGGEQFFPAARRRPLAVRPLTEQEKAALPPVDPNQRQVILPPKPQTELPLGNVRGRGEIKTSVATRGEYRKKTPDKQTPPLIQGEYFKPSGGVSKPVPAEERQLPEGVFIPSLTGTALEGKAADWLRGEMDKVAAAGKSGKTVSLPRYKDFIDRLRKATGGRMQEGAMFDTWKKLVNDELQKASGDTLTSMYRSELGKRIRKSGGVPIRQISKVADAARPPSEAEFKLEMLKAGESTKEVSTLARQDAQYARQAQNRRQKVISYLFGRMIRRPITDIKTSLERTTITPEDIRYGGSNRYESEHTAAFQAFSSDAERTPNTLGMKLTDESGVSGDLPETVTRRVTAIQNRRGEDVHLVSTYDDNGVARLLDPASGSAKIHSALPSILRRYRVLYSILLDQPVQRFHERFSSPAEFMEKFGNEAQQRQEATMSYEAPPTQQFLEQAEGSEGIQGEGGDFMGPERDIINDQGEGALEEARRTAMTPDEARALFDLAVSKQKTGKLSIDEVLEGIKSLRTRPNRQATAALVKMSEGIERENPDADQQQLLRIAANRILQAHERSANMDEFARNMTAQGKKKPSPEDYGISNPAARSRIRKSLSKTEDEKEISNAIGSRIRSSNTPRENKAILTQDVDSLDRTGHSMGAEAGNRLRIVSEQNQHARMVATVLNSIGRKNEKGQWYVVDQMVKSKTGDVLAKDLDYISRQLDNGEAKARKLLESPHKLDKKNGRDWIFGKNGINDLRKFVAAAKKAMSEGNLQSSKQAIDTVYSARREFDESLQYGQSNGVDINEKSNYLPGYHQNSAFYNNKAFWRANPKLGRRFGEEKKFNDLFDAIEKGPYRLESLDIADLAESSITRMAKAANRNITIKSWGKLKTQDGKRVVQSPIPKTREIPAIDPITKKQAFDANDNPISVEVNYGWRAPAGYDLVYPTKGGVPIAVHEDYTDLMAACFADNWVRSNPIGRAMLTTTGLIKNGGLLMYDFFHPARLTQYAMAAIGKGKKSPWFKGGYSALNFDPESLDAAVKQGMIPKSAADWCKQTQTYNLGGRTVQLSNHQVARLAQRLGFNAGKVLDVLNTGFMKEVPVWREIFKFSMAEAMKKKLFDEFLPGLMIESAVRQINKLNLEHPEIPLKRLVRDVNTDMNRYFGNMGRQGVFTNPSTRDLAQILFLSPLWQEGLIGKELVGLTRLTVGTASAAGKKLGFDLKYRNGLPKWGALGNSMAAGLATYFVATQMINLISRRQLTFQNKEKGHSLDAWIPIGNDGDGYWMSPLSTFAEKTHDLIRLGTSKPMTWNAIQQMGANMLGPFGKFGMVLASGKNPSGEYLTSTPAIIESAFGQLAPIPISLSKVGQSALHKVIPAIPPSGPGQFGRQLFTTTSGIKIEPALNAQQQIQGMANQFMLSSGLRPETINIQYTDQPSYAQMRHAIDIGDFAGASRILQRIEKTHTQSQVIDAMNKWARRPFTGSNKAEEMFIDSLSDADKELYTEANVRRMDLLNKWSQWYSAQ